MSLREEQCKKICKILDDVLANRPTERDSLIFAVQLAFESLSEPHWIPVTEKLPEKSGVYTVTDSKGDVVRFVFNADSDSSRRYWYRCAKAWMLLPEPYKGVTE